jgi:hypothetical protein
VKRREFLALLGIGAAAVTFNGLPWPDPTPIVDGVVGVPELSLLQTFQKGDIFTIAGYYAFDPVTGAKLHYLQKFVVTAEVSA